MLVLPVDADIAAATATRSKKTSRSKKKRKRRTKKKRTHSVKAKTNLPVVVLGTEGPIDAPEPFVTPDTPFDAPEGLEGRTIAVWPSHGKYYSGGWRWQRPKLFGTVEDMLSRSFIDPYLVPMLENAGAYVMLPRERDFSTAVTIIDNDWGTPDTKFSTRTGRHHWEEEADSTGFGHRGAYLSAGENPFLMGRSGTVSTVMPADSMHRSVAEWYGASPQEGDRAVYVSYQSYPNSATDAVYTVNHLGGNSKVKVNQQMGGGTWVYLGTFPISTKLSDKPVVTLSNVSKDKNAVVSADAVRIGGGMGTVARSDNGPSGSPAYLEGARYYLQAAGFPEKVYTPENGTNDYMDDYKCRAHWVNHLTADSKLFPDTIGLGIPVDMALAFHTDAGITRDSTTVGTLGLYSTDDGNPLGNGTSRYANRDLTESVTSQVISDIRAIYDPMWSSRGNFDRKYFEIRETKVPAMIIELLSHQNFEDMKHALDPQFRFLVGRAVYKGILKFLAKRYNRPYVVQPLPVESFAIKGHGDGRYTLTWAPVDDPLEPSAKPSEFIVYEATADRYFHPVAKTSASSWSTTINDDKIHAYYVVAANSGGASFPSETLALFDNKHMKPSVEIVNGFTRVSGPEWFDGIEYAGFDFGRNYGVPDGTDVYYIGQQFDFDPTSTLHGGDMGFGESADTESDKVRTGNSFDYPIIHGEALRKAGRGFVSSSLKAFAQSDSAPRAVDLILGLQKSTRKAGKKDTYFETFPPELRTRLEKYRRDGGALMLSGSYLASEIIEADSLSRGEKARFASDILGYIPYIENPNDSIIRTPVATSDFRVGGGSQIMKGIPSLRPSLLESFANSQWAGAGNPQAILPADNKGLVVGRYTDSGLPAAIAVEGNRQASTGVSYPGRVVVVGFPLEAMENSASREGFVAEAMQYLIGDEPVPEEKITKKTTPEKKVKKSKKQLKKEAKEKAAREKAAKKAAQKEKELKKRAAEAEARRKAKEKPASATVNTTPAVTHPSGNSSPKAVPHRRRK